MNSHIVQRGNIGKMIAARAEGGASSSDSGMNEAIVQKLQSALEGLRRDRDQVHRGKELAKERVRLVLEEEKTLKKTVDALKMKDATIAEETLGIRADLPALEATVANATQKLAFEHAALTKVRGKKESLLIEVQESKSKREEKVRLATQFLHNQRQSPDTSIDVKISLQTQKEELARHIKYTDEEDFEWDWTAELLEEISTSLSEDTERLKKDNEEIKEELSKCGVEIPEEEINEELNKSGVDVLEEKFKTVSESERGETETSCSSKPMVTDESSLHPSEDHMVTDTRVDMEAAQNTIMIEEGSWISTHPDEWDVASDAYRNISETTEQNESIIHHEMETEADQGTDSSFG